MLYQPSSGLTCGIVELVKKMVRHEGFEASSVNMGVREIGQRMKVIIVSDKARYFNTLVLGPKSLLVTAALCLSTAIVSAVAWRHYTQADTRLAVTSLEVMKRDIEVQASEISALQSTLDRNLKASAVEIARLENQMARVNALGQRLTELSSWDISEFDFSSEPGLGGVRGPDQDVDGITVNDEIEEGDVAAALGMLSRSLTDRSAQLEVIERVLLEAHREANRSLAGKPVLKSWVSSNFGMRTDPVTGKRAWHNGIDIASREGAPVIAMAPGVVTFAGTKPGYGKVVDIDHGGGLKTRYAHQRELSVETGFFVRKGQQIGEVGSTGRSTGPHVHYEIHKNGRSIDPAQFVYKASPPRS